MRWRFNIVLKKKTHEVNLRQSSLKKIMELATSNKSRLNHIKHTIIIFYIYSQYLIISVKVSTSVPTHQPCIVFILTSFDPNPENVERIMKLVPIPFTDEIVQGKHN